MGLETATFISQLNPANPVGGVDNYATADDHFRLLKAVLQAQFPNLGATAVTPTAAQINFLVGVSSAIQTQLDAKEALANKNQNNGYAGLNASAQLANAQVSAANVTQHQGSLAIATSQVTSGTFADARVAASNVTQHQAALAIATSQLTGNMPDARIVASNITQHQASINIAGSQVNSGTLPDARIAATGVTQHAASINIAATQVNSGVLADARVQQSNVTQHAAALITRNISAKTGVVKTLQNGGSPSGGSDGDIVYIY